MAHYLKHRAAELEDACSIPAEAAVFIFREKPRCVAQSQHAKVLLIAGPRAGIRTRPFVFPPEGESVFCAMQLLSVVKPTLNGLGI